MCWIMHIDIYKILTYNVNFHVILVCFCYLQDCFDFSVLKRDSTGNLSLYMATMWHYLWFTVPLAICAQVMSNIQSVVCIQRACCLGKPEGRMEEGQVDEWPAFRLKVSLHTQIPTALSYHSGVGVVMSLFYYLPVLRCFCIFSFFFCMFFL